MDFRGTDSPTYFAEAALVASVFILPSLAVGSDPASQARFLTASKHLENLSVFIPQILLLVYIIGLRGETRKFHLSAPRTKELLLALILTPLIAALSLAGAALAGAALAGAAPAGAAPAAMIPGASALRAAAAAPDLPLPLFAPLLTASALAVGYREELLYRVYFIRRLELAGTPGWMAVAFSAILFAAGHRYQGLPGVLSAAAVGLLLGAAFLRIRSLHALAWAHAAYDILAILSAIPRA